MRLLKIAVASTVLALAGCAGSGSIKWDNVRELRAGMTKQEVQAKMGRPYSVSSRADGTEVWVWVHVNGLTMASQSVSVIFKDDKATSVPKVPESFK